MHEELDLYTEHIQPTTFTVTINDTNPIYFYCLFTGHCQAGMVGVINPS